MSENENEVDEAWDDDDGDEDGADDAPETAADDEAADKEAAPREPAEGEKRRERRPRRPEYVPEDEHEKRALAFVTDVVREMGMDCRVKARRPDPESPDREVVIEVVGNDAARVIGKKGQVLQALQFLTHRAINRPGQERRHVLVDAEGYRSRRDSSLAAMAKRLGKQAVDDGKIITFEPMSPRDRRVVHLALAKFEGVVTRSEGEGDDRRVQIIPVRRTSG